MSRLENIEDNERKSAKKRFRWWLLPLSFFLGLLFTSIAIYFYLTATIQGQQFVTHIGNKLLNEYLTEHAEIGNIEIQIPPRIVLSDVTIYDHKDSVLFKAEAVRLTPKWPPIQDSILKIDQVVLSHFTGNLSQYIGDADYNYRYAFKLSNKKKQKSKSPIKSIEFRKLIFEEGAFNLADYHQKPFRKPNEKAIDFYRIKTYAINGVLDSINITTGVEAQLNNFTAREQSGFVIKKLNTHLSIDAKTFNWQNLELITNKGSINGDVAFEFKKWSQWKYFNDSVNVDAELNEADIYLNDLGFFAPVIKDYAKNVLVSGKINGHLSDFKTNELELFVGKNSFLKGDIRITGLPNTSKTYIDAVVPSSKLLIKDVDSLIKGVQLPLVLYRLGELSFRGSFKGYLKDFETKGSLYSNLGLANADLKVELYENEKLNHYEGALDLLNFDLGKLTNEKSLGLVSLTSTLNATGSAQENVKATVNAKINDFAFESYNYHNVTVNGVIADRFFKGKLFSTDPNANLDLNGSVDFSQRKPKINAETTIRNLDLNKLNLSKDSIQIKSIVEMKFEGDKVENFIGDIKTKNLYLKVNGTTYETGFTKIKGEITPRGKLWTLNSDFAEANIETSLPLVKLGESLINHGISLLPKDLGFQKETLNDYVKAYIVVKEPSILNSVLPKDVELAPFTQADILIDDSIEKIDLDFTAEYFGVAGIRFEHPSVKLNKLGHYLSSNSSISTLTKDSFSLNNYALNITNDSNLLYFNHGGYLNDSLLEFNLNNSLTYSQNSNSSISLDSSLLVFQKDTFKLMCDTLVWQNLDEFIFKDLILELNTERVLANGYANFKNDYDIRYSIFGINLNKVAPFLPEYFKVAEGEINGNGHIESINGLPLFEASLYVNPISFRDMAIESIEIESHYDVASKLLGLDAVIKSNEGYDIITLNGGLRYFKEPTFDLNFSLKKVPNSFFETLASGVVSNLKGTVSANVKLNGNLENPALNGWVALDSSSLYVDYLGVNYKLNDTIKVNSTDLFIKRLVLIDEFGQKGVLNGNITHDMLNKFDLNLGMKCNNFNLLNTKEQDNDLYYGQLYGTGTGKFTGPLLRANIACDIVTEKGTKFYLPIEEEQGYSQESYIRFVNKNEEIEEYRANDQDFSLDLNITMNTNAETQLIFDKQLGDIIKASGDGKINMQLSPAGEFQMFGSYVIDNGNYLFTAFDLINKKFEIEKGSKILWAGDPYDAQIDIKAIYLLNTNAYNLASSIPSYDQARLEQYKNSIAVAANANLTGSLLKPEILLDFDFVDDGVTDVASLKRDLDNLDLSEEELTKQVVSLLVLSRFMPIYNTNNFDNSLFSTGVSTALGDLITNQVSYWLSSVSDDIQVNLDYRENQFTEGVNSDLSQRELELALSTTLFNDRVIVDYAYEFQNGYTPNMQAAYKLNRDGTARILVFKRQKLNVTQSGNINRAGFGVFLKKEFNSLEELFKKKDDPKK